MSKKERADVLLAEQGLAESREKAKRLVMAGLVYVIREGRAERVDKPGQALPVDCELQVKPGERFVGRGGEKLATALEAFGLDVTGITALDVGASTGGFTHCLLEAGAAKVYALDVGKNQLHEKLVRDPRVVSIEQTNIRHADPGLLPEPVDLAVVDCSFISLTLVLPACVKFLKPGGGIVALVKPQFELSPGEVKKGVVRDEALRQKAVRRVIEFGEAKLGLVHKGTVPSKIKGPKGNQEYLVYFRLMS